MLLFYMDDQSQNPFAAPTLDADVDPQVWMSRRLPISTYCYVGIVWCIGAFAGGTIGFISAIVLPPVAAIGVVSFSAVATGFFGASRMYRRLADIHQRKVAWEIQQAEWANGIG